MGGQEGERHHRFLRHGSGSGCGHCILSVCLSVIECGLPDMTSVCLVFGHCDFSFFFVFFLSFKVSFWFALLDRVRVWCVSECACARGTVWSSRRTWATSPPNFSRNPGILFFVFFFPLQNAITQL